MKTRATALARCSALVVLFALSHGGAAASQGTAIADLVSGAGVIGASNFDVVIKVDDLPFLEDEDEDEVEDLFPNINMVGMSYDLLKGNPHPTSGGLDPGWRFELFETNYDGNDTVFFGTQEYRVPDGVQVASCPVCNLEFSSSEAQTAKDYTKSLHVNVKVGGRAKGLMFRASFKASADVKAVQSRASETNNFFMESSAECSFYCPRIRFDDAPRLSGQFRDAVLALPATHDEGAYDRFLDLFGTHFAIGVTMGGTFGVRHEISEASLQTMKQLGVDVRTSASFSAMSFSGSAKVMTNAQKEQASAFSSRTESQSTFSYGGQPIGNPADPADTSLWLDAVRADPLPISYELADIADLLTVEFFPDDANIAAKRANLASSLDTYCERLEDQGEIICDEPPAPAPNVEHPYQECVARGGFFQVGGKVVDEIGSPGATLTWRDCQAKCKAEDFCNAWIWRSARHANTDMRRTCKLGETRSNEFTPGQHHVSCASTKCLDCVSTGPAAERGALPAGQTDLDIQLVSRANTQCCMPNQTCLRVCLEDGGQFVSRQVAERLCEERGGSLCTHSQVEDNLCQGLGCGYDAKPAWIADVGSTRAVYKKYALSAEATYWNDARAQCESTGGQLPSLHHEGDNDALLDFYTTETNFVDMWIGANDVDKEGTFEWSDGSPFDYDNWRSGEPNNKDGNEDCAIMETDTLLWNDGDCVRQLQFACEYPLTASDNTRYLTSRIGPDGLLDSFDDFYAWNQIGRPTLTELRIRHTANFVPTIQAVYGSFVLSQHGYHDPTVQPESFKLAPGEHIVSVDACYLESTAVNANNIRGLRFRTSNSRESPFFGSTTSAATPGCRTINFPSRLLYLSGEGVDAVIRSLTFHHKAPTPSSE